jgi:hypothetical protein
MEFNKEDLIAEYNGKRVLLNPRLLKKQEIADPEVIQKLIDSHIEKLKIIEQMDMSDDPVNLHNLAVDIEKIEFKQQELWGFPKNRDYHYWYNVPKCTCPYMDNRDNYGTPFRLVDDNCPVHGKLAPLKKTRRTFWSKWF